MFLACFCVFLVIFSPFRSFFPLFSAHFRHFFLHFFPSFLPLFTFPQLHSRHASVTRSVLGTLLFLHHRQSLVSFARAYLPATSLALLLHRSDGAVRALALEAMCSMLPIESPAALQRLFCRFFKDPDARVRKVRNLGI